jgi:hypothetical protein
MREVNLEDPTDTPAGTVPAHSFCVYGPTRSGKTTFAASFPRPIFLSDATEAGWESIRNMDPEAFFEPGRKPRVIALETIGDLVPAMEKVKAAINSGEARTIVFDSLTFYSDLYLADTAARQATPDNRALYGMLGTHLRDLRVKVHSVPCNTVWLCLDRVADEHNPVGGPMIPGQQGQKFAAGCNFLLYARRTSVKTAQTTVDTFALHSRPFGMNMAGSRLGINADNLPNPFSGTYATMMAALGYDVDALRARIAAGKKPPAPLSAPRATTVPVNARPVQARATVSSTVRR